MQQPHRHSRNDVQEVPFRFDLQRCRELSHEGASLPPSLSSKDEKHSYAESRKAESSISYDIVYAVTASAFSSNGLITSATEQILIRPGPQTSPPDYHVHEVAGEHFTATSSGSRSKTMSLKRAKFRIDVAAQQPPAMVFDGNVVAQSATTEVSLLLKVSRQCRGLLQDLPRQCRIKSHLLTKTVIVPRQATQMRGQDSRTQSTRSNLQEFTLATSSWERCQSDDESLDDFAITRLSFLFRCADAQSLCPAFSTPILSRSYALSMEISLPENGGQTLSLTLPLAFVIGADQDRTARCELLGALERKSSS